MSSRIYPLIIYLLLTVLNPCPGLFTVLVIEPNTGQWMPGSKGTHLKKALLVQCPAPHPAPCSTSSVRTNRADGCTQEPGVSLAVFRLWVIVRVVGWFTLEGIIRSLIAAPARGAVCEEAGVFSFKQLIIYLVLYKTADQAAILSASAQRDPFENRQSDGFSGRVLPSILNSTCLPTFEPHDVIM